MSSWAERQTIAEINNPNSPYYIGGPSIHQQIQNVLNSGNYKTNYFGSSARGILAQPNADCVQFKNKNSERKKIKDIIGLVGAATTAVIAFLLLRKIPGSGKALSSVGKALTLPFKGLKYIGKAAAWLFRGSKT